MYVPAAQAAQALIETLPLAGLNVPAAQNKHEVWPVDGLNVPCAVKRCMGEGQLRVAGAIEDYALQGRHCKTYAYQYFRSSSRPGRDCSQSLPKISPLHKSCQGLRTQASLERG